jgi:hypothetical protein
MHRYDIKGETKITKIGIRNNKLICIESCKDPITHCVGVDFNSLYPSAFSSVENPNNPYTDGRMYMPSGIKSHLQIGGLENGMKFANHIISSKQELFIAEIKCHIDKAYSNAFLNFSPIFRNIDITIDKKTIGSDVYDHMKSHNIPVDQTERKLTQLLDTNNEFMSFSSYYLWCSIDRCHFIIDDIKSIIIFEKHKAFEPFVTEFKKKRVDGILKGNKGLDTFYSIFCLNGSYGYDIMNESNFPRSKLLDKDQTFTAQMSVRFRATRKLSDEMYQIQVVPKSYSCKTCIQEGYFTLDNAKFWYLNFYYNLMQNYLNMRRIQFVEGDTDSAYFSIAGNPNESNTQAFRYVIKDEEFYNKHIYDWVPNFFYTSDKSNPSFESKLDNSD